MTGRAGGNERTLLRPAVVAVLVSGGVCAAVATATAGGRGLASAALAVGLVLSFLLAGQLPVAAAARGMRGLGAALLVLGYTTRVGLLLAAYRVVTTADDDLHAPVVGVTIMVTGLGWTAGTVWAFLRWRPLYVEPESADAPRERPAPR